MRPQPDAEIIVKGIPVRLLYREDVDPHRNLEYWWVEKLYVEKSFELLEINPCVMYKILHTQIFTKKNTVRSYMETLRHT